MGEKLKKEKYMMISQEYIDWTIVNNVVPVVVVVVFKATIKATPARGRERENKGKKRKRKQRREKKISHLPVPINISNTICSKIGVHFVLLKPLLQAGEGGKKDANTLCIMYCLSISNTVLNKRMDE